MARPVLVEFIVKDDELKTIQYREETGYFHFPDLYTRKGEPIYRLPPYWPIEPDLHGPIREDLRKANGFPK